MVWQQSVIEKYSRGLTRSPRRRPPPPPVFDWRDRKDALAEKRKRVWDAYIRLRDADSAPTWTEDDERRANELIHEIASNPHLPLPPAFAGCAKLDTCPCPEARRYRYERWCRRWLPLWRWLERIG